MCQNGPLGLGLEILPTGLESEVCQNGPFYTTFSELNYPLKYMFGKSIEKGVFPNALKIARVTPLFKGGDPSDISNYRSFFPVSRKIWSVSCITVFINT